MNNDINYNCKVTFDDSTTALVFATRLHNEDLDHWYDWECTAGVNSIYIYEDKVYGGECKNDYLGELHNKWELIHNSTTCKKVRCSGCTVDLLQKKFEKQKIHK
jgi:hypothetical protein